MDADVEIDRRPDPAVVVESGGAVDAPSDDKAADTARAVDTLAAEHARELPRDRATGLGAAYARYSTRGQDSVQDQVRELLADAARRGVHVPREYILYDMGVRGRRRRRAGLDALTDLLRRKAVGTVFFFTTSRLSRKLRHALEFVEEEVVERGLRAVFVRSGIDTADGRRWKAHLALAGLVDELGAESTVDSVRAAQVGRFRAGLVYSTLPVGYTRRPTGRLGKAGRPLQAIAVDPAAADWVRQIYRWYVGDAVPLDQIARRLNAPGGPRPPAGAARWSHGTVRRLLTNPRYRGEWAYGVREVRWLTGKDYGKVTRRDAPLCQEQREELRVVDDALWYRAAELLAAAAARLAGRKPADPAGGSRLRAVGGLFVCHAHGRTLLLSGSYGRYLRCPDCQASSSPTSQRDHSRG